MPFEHNSCESRYNLKHSGRHYVDRIPRKSKKIDFLTATVFIKSLEAYTYGNLQPS